MNPIYTNNSKINNNPNDIGSLTAKSTNKEERVMPWDPNGNTPDPSQFQIDWSLSGDALVVEIERKYEALVQWLQNNPGCYNGYLLLLQNTLEIGSHMGTIAPPDTQQKVISFMNFQLSSQTSNVTLMQLLVDMSIKGTAVQSGVAAAEKFAEELSAELSKESDYGSTFRTMALEAANMKVGISSWAASHQQIFTDPTSGKTKTVWLDDDGTPMNFQQFAALSSFQVGTFLIKQANTQQYIDHVYQTQIQQLLATCKDPWLLLLQLMMLISQRDADNGRVINGTANNLQTLTDANSSDILAMLNDLKQLSSANVKDFYAKFNNLRDLIELNPNFSSLSGNIEQVFGIVNGMVSPVPAGKSIAWNVSSGNYNLPLNVPVTYTSGGKTQTMKWDGSKISIWDGTSSSGTPVKTVASSTGLTFLSGGSCTITAGTTPLELSFGQLAAMGNYDAISSSLANSQGTTNMSNLINTITSLQTFMNSPAQAMNQMLQQETQYSQTIESFMKACYQNYGTQESTPNKLARNS